MTSFSRVSTSCLILFVILFLISTCTEGQFILLKKKKNYKIIEFKIGDKITYKLKDDSSKWKSARIYGIYNTFFNYFTNQVNIVPIDKINTVRITRRGLNYKEDGTMLIIAGLVLGSIPIINEYIAHQPLHLTKPELYATPALIVSGFILRQLSLKNCKIGKRYSLEIIQL